MRFSSFLVFIFFFSIGNLWAQAEPQNDQNLSDTELNFLRGKAESVKGIYDFFEPTYRRIVDGLVANQPLTYEPGKPEARTPSSGNATEIMACLLIFDRLLLNVQEISMVNALKRKIAQVVFKAPGRQDGVENEIDTLTKIVKLKVIDQHKVDYRIRDFVNGALVAFFGKTLALPDDVLKQKFFEVTSLLRSEVYNWFGRWREGALTPEETEQIHGFVKPASVAPPVENPPAQ